MGSVHMREIPWGRPARRSRMAAHVCAAALLVLALAATVANASAQGSHDAAVQPVSVPSSPQYPEYWISTTSVDVAWDPPAVPGGSGTITYQARAWSTVPPTAISNLVSSCSTTALGCRISGLTSGTFYYIDIVAMNSAGTGNPSAYQQVQPGTTASAPRSVSTSAGRGTVTIRWQPPTTFGTGAFAWYSAGAFSGSGIGAGTASSSCTTFSTSELSCMISGLVNGRTYYVGVAAVTSQHAGLQSARIKVIVGTKPTAPRDVTVQRRSRAALVAWRAPSSNGGCRISSYRIRVFRHGAAQPLRVIMADGSVRSKRIGSLVNGRTYDVTVAAANVIGQGPQSRRHAVTPRAR